jgi:hypothetical protein
MEEIQMDTLVLLGALEVCMIVPGVKDQCLEKSDT